MPEQPDFFSRPAVRRILWFLLYASCAAAVLAGFVYPTKAPFEFVSFYGFYAILGFASCAGLIKLAKYMGKILKRPGDYYDQ
ncbi:hypothetical protein [Pseudodesulfovibrio senegalensis]|uniref:Uncharacterized protein n=1 Tax=Pseudodesulfovibrio senegalensis TaxID=1721087 RepID=A0A6N6N452_9BACT|nr:hypothetical protein [Pseudodesulfovibrio senegalensis]KAB1442856.1 hypothetical protein F8A88_00850 [Pseudodesulfovibrio senegalensis]